MKTTFSATLPWFPGFYDSRLSSILDREYESDPPTSVNWAAGRLAMAQAWVEAFSKATGLDLKFEELSSPSSYNFETDRAFVTLSLDTLKKLEGVRNTPSFAKVLRDQFTSRPGFIPFYSHDVENPKWQRDVTDFDHNEISSLIAAYVLQQGKSREDLLDTLYNTPDLYEAAQSIWGSTEQLSGAL